MKNTTKDTMNDGYINGYELIGLIESHKDYVKSGDRVVDGVFGLAHDQIKEIVLLMINRNREERRAAHERS